MASDAARCGVWLLCLTAVSVGGCQRSGESRTSTDRSPSIEQGASVGKNAAAAPSPRVVVIGGGLAGLAAAYELERRGISTALIEATDVLGGRVATAHYGEGLVAEYGMQEMWEGNPLLDLARDLHVPVDGEVGPALSSVLIDDTIHPFVQETTDQYLASFLSTAERTALRSWTARAKGLRQRVEKVGLRDEELRHLQEISFAAWIGEGKLPRRVAEFLRLTMECELAADWEHFSALIALEEMGVFLDEGKPNYHIQGGNSKIIDALGEAIRGPKILSATVTAIARRARPDGTIEARVSYLKEQRIETVIAERVVVAVPFVRLHQIQFDPPLSEDKWQAVYTLARGHYTVVHFLVEKAARKLWMVGERSPFPVLTNGPLGVIYGVTQESPPSQPLEVFSLLIYGTPAGSFHMAPRERKIKELLVELDRRWPGLAGHVRSSHVYTYHPTAIPVWPPGRSPLDQRSEQLRQPELGLYLAGDYTLNAHSDGAVRSGQSAAKRIIEELLTPSR